VAPGGEPYLSGSMPNSAAKAAKSFLPKLASTFIEGYRLADFRRDAAAGLTVAVVALPLSMAIAAASGVSPERGVHTAIVGGLVVSALGGSRFQIGGPAGAFIVLVSATVARFGLEGLALAVMISGVLLTLLGAFRLGGLIRHIPHPVTIGFTAGIAVTILASQLKDLFGLTLTGPEPGHLVEKVGVLLRAAPTLSWAALLLGVGVAAAIVGLRRWRPAWPGMLIAVVGAALAAALFDLPVTTIADRFGDLPRTLPLPQLPNFDRALFIAVLPAALSFTLLGGIESLLSAVVADGMTGRKHRSNIELVAQGLANVASSLFGGISVTGTIARTATNIRAGARSPVSGILHSVFLLLFLLIAAPLAGFIPMAALAGVLVIVAWNMTETSEFTRLCRQWRSGAILFATFGVTLLNDLTIGIACGCLLAFAFWTYDRLHKSGPQS